MTAHPPRLIHQLADLQPDTHNANRGTRRGHEALAASLKTHGAGRSILVDRDGRVIAGNKTLAEALALGLAVRVVETTGEELVVVQRTNLDLATDPSARALALADNRVAELNLDWDPTLMKGFADAGIDLDSLWTPRELEQVIGIGTTGQTDDDAVVAMRDTDIQPGDLFALGAHRLVCGDATDADTVRRLLEDAQPSILITDPPYGVDYDAAWRLRAGCGGRHAVGRVANDDQADWTLALAWFPGDVAYVWHAGLHAGVVAASLAQIGFDVRAQLIWVKPHFVMGRGDFHWQHEPAWYAVRHGQPSQWSGDRTQSTVWSVPNLNPFSGGPDVENPRTAHSTQKPVELYTRALLCNSAPGAGLYDPFVGSGTAIIAAEKTGRQCYGLELDPRDVQIAIDRWEAYTGQSAVRLSFRSTETRV